MENAPVFIHPSAIIDNGAILGNGSKVWHFSHIMSKAQIGNNCNIGQNVYIDNNTLIGNNVKIQNNVSVYSHVTIEDDCFLGPSMVFTNVINPRAFIERKHEFKKTLIKKGATIGANATIICGISLGEYCMIGAGSVVTKSVPNYALMIGNPARQLGWVSKNGHRLNFESIPKNHALHSTFPDAEIAICSETGENYILHNNEITIP